MRRFTMRIEVWEKNPETDECLPEFGELYFRDEDKYYTYTNEGFVEIPNPFTGRIPLKQFNMKCHEIYANNDESGVFVPETEILSIDGYPIEGIDIIFREKGIFPYLYDFYYDDKGQYHSEVIDDYYDLIDNLK